jgi:hypothetical protein
VSGPASSSPENTQLCDNTRREGHSNGEEEMKKQSDMNDTQQKWFVQYENISKKGTGCKLTQFVAIMIPTPCKNNLMLWCTLPAISRIQFLA